MKVNFPIHGKGKQRKYCIAHYQQSKLMRINTFIEVNLFVFAFLSFCIFHLTKSRIRLKFRKFNDKNCYKDYEADRYGVVVSYGDLKKSELLENS